MQQTGVLVLTCPIRSLTESVTNHLATATKHVSKRLYLKLEPGQDKLHPPLKRQVTDLSFLYKFIPTIYTKASVICNTLDVRLLLTSFKNPTCVENRLNVPRIDLALSDSSDPPASIKLYINEQFQRPCLHVVKLNKYQNEGDNCVAHENIQMYNTVILGGTFDKLHNGHKILLSAAVSRAIQKVVIGVTSGDMLKKKILWELIEPLEERVGKLLDFLNDIDPTITYSIVPIYDPLGPAVEDPNVECLVVSEETKLGGIRINEERAKRNMKQLDVLQVNLLEEPHHLEGQELKMSSSNERQKLLGCFLKSAEPQSIADRPFCIALIGGLMNDTSVICQFIQSLGVPIINTYDIISQLLLPSSSVYQEIMALDIDVFGPNGEVDLKKFNAVVSTNKKKKEAVRAILLPSIKSIVQSKIAEFPCGLEGTVVVVRMPEFLRSNWHYYFHHVWVSLLPEQKRIQKLKNFYQVSDNEASQMFSSLPSNLELVKIAHVVFSPQWGEESTKAQVEKAYEKLKTWTICKKSVL